MTLYMIIIESMGHYWRFPMAHVAKHCANYYVDTDPKTTFEEEYQRMLSDPEECVEWFWNNMDWVDVEDVAELFQKPAPITEPNWSCTEVMLEKIDPNVKYEGIK